ncbi:MAG: Kae1-associated serine/threonine protein kinase [Candidatus Aenigmarchaeota archaeon]|nr:Kae1-associated serine/threonine protein kinase [Candidatus Aenigmarchaeota archaeon]
MAGADFRGAEALLRREGEDLVKDRIPKGYRLPELDLRLRKQRTRMEASLLATAARLGVPVPRVREVGDTTIRMEWLPGERVKDILDVLPPQEQRQLAAQIGEAVARLHAGGIAHGDLTTSNMIYKDKRLYLIDFGLARMSHRAEDQAADLFLLAEALQAGHFPVRDAVWATILKAYKAKYAHAAPVLAQVARIRARRRYRSE